MWLIALKAVFANILVAVSVIGFGIWIPRFLPDSFSRSTKWICAVVGGVGTLGSLLFIVGQFSYTRMSIGIVLALGVILALFGSWQIYLPIRKPAVIVIALLAITAVAGLAQPVGDWDVDGISYHFVGPKVWLRDGIIRPIPDNSGTSFPVVVEMVFGALRAFGGERAQGVSATWTLALFLAMAGALGRRSGLGARGAWWVAALLATMGAVYEGTHSGFIDAVYVAFLLAAMRVGFDATEKKHFVAFGFFCGLAMATKYPALVAVPAIILCAIWGRKGFTNFQRIRNACLVAAVAGIVASPVYLRNWILLGSPVYPPPPSTANFFHPKYYSAAGLTYLYQYARYLGQGIGHGFGAFLLLPYNLTYHTSNFNGAGGIGLAPLAFGWLGVLASWREEFARRLAVAGFLLMLIWFLTLQNSRYLIHGYAIAAVFGVLGWKYAISIVGKRGKLLCAAVIAVSLAYGFVLEVKSRIPDLHAVFSPAYAQQRRLAEIPYYESFEYLNHELSVKRVLILDETVMAYYSDKVYVKPFGQWKEQLLPDASTPVQVLGNLGELHVSHILDVQSKISGFCVPPGFSGVVLVFERPGQRVYKVVSQ